MTKTIINTDTRNQVVVDGNGSILTIAATGSITQPHTTTVLAAILEDGTNNRIAVNGLLVDTYANAGDDGVGIMSRGDSSTISISSTGDVIGAFGIMSDGADAVIVNHGLIAASLQDGIDCHGIGASVDNSGTISGGNGIVVDATGAVITNEAGGRILGSGKLESGVVFDLTDGEKGKIVNHGIFNSGITIYHGNITIISDGTIGRSLFLGDGNDTVNLRGGTYLGTDGDIVGGYGDDTLITDNAGYTLVEAAGGGDNDTIKSTVSYTLPLDVETLTLLGKKNINATGNDDTGDANYLYGNSGDNILNGLGGENELYGRGGTDTLIGNANEDIFGIGKGYGHDTVIGFTHGVDKVDVYHIPGVTDFTTLQPHIEKHGSDTWLNFGANILILEGVDPSTLDAGDFLFNY